MTYKANRPSKQAIHLPKFTAPKVGVEELIRRQAAGLDLWSGQPLKASERFEWLQEKGNDNDFDEAA